MIKDMKNFLFVISNVIYSFLVMKDVILENIKKEKKTWQKTFLG